MENRLHGSVFFGDPRIFLDKQLDSGMLTDTLCHSGNMCCSVHDQKAYLFALTRPERYKLPFLLRRKQTPPTTALLGVDRGRSEGSTNR